MQDAEERCPCGELIRPEPPDPEGFTTWACVCRRFGYLLPPDYVATHPDDARVQVCGRKRFQRTTPVPTVAV